MNKRYAHPTLTFKAWDTVVRELIERRDALAQGLLSIDSAGKRQAYREVVSTLEFIRREWQRGEQ